MADRIGHAHPVLPQQTKPLGMVWIVGRDHPPLAGRDDLAGMETETGHFRMPADRLALVTAADRTGGVLQDLYSMFLAQREETIDIGRQTDLVDHHNGLGAGCDRRLGGIRIEIVGPRIDICEDGRRARVADGVGRGDKRHRRTDHLVAGKNLQHKQRQVQSRRATRDGHRVRRAAIVGHHALELGHLGALADPAALDDRLGRFGLFRSEIWLCDRNQVAYPLLCQ